MIRHIEFCLDEIECEIDAAENDTRSAEGRLALRLHLWQMRSLLSDWKAEATEPLRAPSEAVASVCNDDLTLICGIDATDAEMLAERGVTRFRAIADLFAADIAALGDDPELALRIARENWIEQAAILATGELTHYARRLQQGYFFNVVTFVSPDLESGTADAAASSAVEPATEPSECASAEVGLSGAQTESNSQEPEQQYLASAALADASVCEIAISVPAVTSSVVQILAAPSRRVRSGLIKIAASLLIFFAVGAVEFGTTRPSVVVAMFAPDFVP